LDVRNREKRDEEPAMVKTACPVVLALLVAWCPLPVEAQVMERVSVGSDGNEAVLGGSLDISKPVADASGRWLVFHSDSDDLVAGDHGGQRDVFLRDLILGTTTRVSVSVNGGGDAAGDSQNAVISGSGRFVAFDSTADDLVEGDTNGVSDVFLFDRNTGSVTLVSIAHDGGAGDGDSSRPSLSTDGRYMAFTSSATNLVIEGANTNSDTYVRDLFLGETTKATYRLGGGLTEANSWRPVISAGGRHVVYTSGDNGLVAGDLISPQDIFVTDLETGVIERVSISSAGGEGTDRNGAAAINGDGSVVVFWSRATELVADDTNGQDDIFIRDRDAGTTTRINLSPGGDQADGGSWHVTISDDGRFVAYTSDATNLVSGDDNGEGDVFSFDRESGTTRLHSLTLSGDQGQAYSNAPALTPDGRFVIFRSGADNFVDDDLNQAEDVFIAWGPATVCLDSFESGDLVVWSDTTY
jgi:Tol biopolymer transport system component